MSWQDELPLITRILVGDMTVPYKYTDAYLQQVVVTAGLMVSQDIPLAYAYTFSVSGRTISPDPMTSSDLVAQTLFPLKAACILNIGSFQGALGQGIRVRDGDSAIDTSVSFRGWRDIMEFGPTKTYEQLKWQILQRSSEFGIGTIGGAIVNPSRLCGSEAISDVQTLYDNFAVMLDYRGAR